MLCLAQPIIHRQTIIFTIFDGLRTWKKNAPTLSAPHVFGKIHLPVPREWISTADRELRSN